MFYRIILIAFLIALPIEGKLNAFEQERISGGFTTCTKYLYDYKAGQLDSNSKRVGAIFKYDRNGYRIEARSYYLDAPIGYIDRWEYDSIGNRLEESTSYANGTKFWWKTYQYDDNHNAIEQIEYKEDGSVIEKLSFRYNDQHQEIERIYYYDDGTIKERDTTLYYEIGKKSELNCGHYRMNSTLEGWENYKYDTAGHRKEQRERKYDETGKLIQDNLDVFTSPNGGVSYDMLHPNADSTEQGRFNIDYIEVFEKTSYEYDEKGRTTAIIEYKSETEVSRKDTYKYDELGNISESIYYNPNNPFIKTEYIYTK